MMKIETFIRRRNQTVLFLAVMIALVGISIAVTQFNIARSFTSVFKAVIWGISSFYPDGESIKKTADIIVKLWETILISISSTFTASIPAMVLAVIGSRTTRVNVFFTPLARGIGSFFRNVPLVAWAMILMLTFGQSTFTGFLALFLSSLGFLTRAFMETLDEVGKDVVDALKATGSSYNHIIFQAVLPSSMPQTVSWLLYMIETNIRDATLVGFLTGTGIGFLFDIYYKSFNYHAASLVVIATVIVVIMTEALSNRIRRIIL